MNDEIMCFTLPRLLVPVDPEKQAHLESLLMNYSETDIEVPKRQKVNKNNRLILNINPLFSLTT